MGTLENQIKTKHEDGKMMSDPINEKHPSFEKLEYHIELADKERGMLDLSDFAASTELHSGMFAGIRAKALRIRLRLSDHSARENGFDLSSLNDLEFLESIEIVNLNFYGIDFSCFPKLTRIFTRSTRVKDLQGIEHCLEMTDLNLMGSHIKSLPSLERLNKLERINLVGSQITHIEKLGIIPSLISLDVSRTNVCDIPHILNFPKFADYSAQHLGFQNTPSASVNNPMLLLSGMRGKECAEQTVMYLKGEHPDLKDFSGLKKNIETILSEASPVEIVSKFGRLSVENIGPSERNNPIELNERLHALKGHIVLIIDEAAFVQCPHTVSRRLGSLLQAFKSEMPIFLLLETHTHLLSATIEDKYTAEMMDAPLLDSVKRLILSVQQLKPFMMPPPDLEAAALEAVPEIRNEVSPEDFLDVAKQAHRLLSSEELNRDIEPSVVDTAASFRDNLEDISINNKPRLLKRAAARLSGFISLLSNAATLHTWFATYAVGLNMINQLQDLLKRLIGLFS